MNEAIAFIQEFIGKEYEAFQACYRERDEEVFEEAQTAVDRMYASGLRTIVQRGMEPEEEWFTNGEESLGTIKERVLFQVKEYEHPEFGSLYGCYLSHPIGWVVTKNGEKTTKWDDSFSCIQYVAKIPNRTTGAMKFRIIAEYTCTSKKYLYGSKVLEPFGPLKAITQFQPPEDQEDRIQYEEDSKLAAQLAAASGQAGTAETEQETAPVVAAGESQEEAIKRVPVLQADNPDQAEFIRVFGPLEEKALWGGEEYEACLKLLGGRFYTHGFFPDGTDPYRKGLPWKEIREAMEFLHEVVGILNEGGCTSLNSAGDRRYYPFLCWDEKMAYLPSFVTKIPNRMDSRSRSLMDRSCLFWGKGREAELKEYLDMKTIKAFKQAGKRMKERLKDRGEFAIVTAPYRGEYPVFLGGKFVPGLFAGVFTTRV